MTAATYPAGDGAATFRLVQRHLLARLPDASAAADGALPIEAARGSAVDPPRLTTAPVLEGHALRAVRVMGDPAPGFAAFLDGTQATRVVAYHDGMPIVHGTVAAVVRVRHNRRFTTWARGPRVERRLYAPCAYLPPTACEALDELRTAGLEVVDTTAPRRGAASAEPLPAHPAALVERALAFVQEDREIVEKHLAEQWCRLERGPLFIDGGIQESELVAGAPCVAGVVKSHRTIYVDGDALRIVLGLRCGQRSSAFRVSTGRRPAVASWYLRLRDPAGRDPLWGLVRVEASYDPVEPPERLAERADLISRWVLAEATPLALPDGRWDKMVYGVRDCEEFLRAVC